MKLIRFRENGIVKPGVILDNGTRINCSSFGEDYDEHFFGTDGISRLREWVNKNRDNAPKVAANQPLDAPLVRPSKLVCVGLNYAKHAAESGAEPPSQPVLFMKATSAICGPNDDLILPRKSRKTDWEVELGIVIGRRASYVEEENAPDHIAGYVLHNDYSEREYQMEHGGQWVKGKSADTFAPLGPFIASADEIPEPNNLRLWLNLNGETLQDSNTSDMIFHVPHLISYISRYMTLLPGDIVSTGTPEGVGLGFNPPRFLKPGDEVELGIDGLGSSRQKVKSWSA